MPRLRFPRLRQLFRHRVAPGEIIPPDARVDPSGFPEEDFPLYCPSCEYLLRGLPEDRCPECGESFDRRRLLVEQYVVEQGKRLSRQTNRYAKWTEVTGLMLMLIGATCFGVLNHVLDPTKPRQGLANHVEAFFPVAFTAFILGTVLFVVSSILSYRAVVAGKKKCRQVFDAIDRGTVSFKKAQRYMWVLLCVWLACVVGLFAWEARDVRGWLHYYSERPSRLMLPVGVAAGVGIIAVIFARVRAWLRRRWCK